MVHPHIKRKSNDRESSEESISDFCDDWKCCVYVVCCRGKRRCNVGWTPRNTRKRILI
jgi:hypothetical protein